jgi:phage tail tube protein FII
MDLRLGRALRVLLLVGHIGANDSRDKAEQISKVITVNATGTECASGRLKQGHERTHNGHGGKSYIPGSVAERGLVAIETVINELV